MGDPGGLGRVAVRVAELASQAVDVVDAPMPAHGAMLKVGTTLTGRARCRARPAAPLLHSVQLLAGGLLPTSAQGRQRQISREAPAAKPNRAPRAGDRTSKRDGVANDTAAATLRVARTDPHIMFAQRAHELALITTRGRARPHDPLQRLPRPPLRSVTVNAVVAVTPRVGHPLTRPHPATPSPPRPRLQPPQPKPLLKLARRVLGSRPVEMHARPTPILSHQSHDNMRMVRTAR